MAGALNKVTLIGRLGKDPQKRNTRGGDVVVSMSVATAETWRDKSSGERKERTEWHNVVIFNEHAAKFAEQYCSKGCLVYVEGQLQHRKWTDDKGIDRYVSEVVLTKFKGELKRLDGKDDADSGTGRSSSGTDAGRSAAEQSQSLAEAIDDDIPF